MWISVFIIVVSLVVCTVFYNKNRDIRLKYKKLLSQKKSSEVRLGFLTEHLAPLLNSFPYDIDPEDSNTILVPLGNPIDYFVVTKDEIGFVEIKSGNAKLNGNQRHIKKLVKEKKVVWHEVRINPEGNK